MPVVITLLSMIGVVTPQFLSKNRKYAILINFIIAAVLTPTPDIVNQSLMAGPLCILYEVGIICARIFGRRRRSRSASRTAAVPSRRRRRADQLSPLWTSPPSICPSRCVRGIRDAGFVDHHADPGGGAAAGPQGQGRGRPVPDGHRQDGGLPDRRLHALPAHPAPATSGADRAARAHHRAHARAGRADRGRRAAARRPHRPRASSPSTAASTTTSSARRCGEGCDVLVGTPGPAHRLPQAARLVAPARSRSSSSTRPTGCSTWASSPTCASSCAGCPSRRSGSRSCSRRRCPSG